MQSFPQEPALDYSRHLSQTSSLSVGIASAHRSLQYANRYLHRAIRRLATIADNSKSRITTWRLAAVAADLRRATRHAPVLALVVASTGKENQDYKHVMVKYALEMSALVQRLLQDVDRDFQLATGHEMSCPLHDGSVKACT